MKGRFCFTSESAAKMLGNEEETQLSRSRWSSIYFIIAALNILGFVISLGLGHQVMSSYLKSVSVNSEWENRSSAFGQLGRLSADLNAPGNNLFATEAVNTESANLALAKHAFDKHLKELKEDIDINVNGANQADILAAVETIRMHGEGIESTAQTIFELFARNRRSEAAAEMAVMDRHFADLTKELSRINTLLSSIQRENFQSQKNSAQALKRYEFIIIIFVIIVIILVALYGRNQEIQLENRNRKIHKSESRFRQFTEMIPQIVFEANEIGDLLFLNKFGLKFFNLDPRSLREGLNLIDLCEKEDQYRVFEWIRREENARGGNGLEITTGEPQVGPAKLYCNEFQSIDGNNGFIGLIVDITEHKLLEKSLLEARATAERGSEAKSSFLTNMSHEIRTPINGVLGMLELLIQTNLDEDQEDYVETAQSSARSLLNLINDILDFSKIEAGKLNIEVRDFSLLELLEEVGVVLAPQTYEKNIELIFIEEKNLPRVILGDPGRVMQVLLNLVGNAIKFTHEGEVVVRVSSCSGEGADLELRFEIADTGIGIPSDRVDRLFKQFSQVGSSTTREFGGSGLGLAISKQLVELMGGEIGVESEIGKGTTFWFTVRAKVSKEASFVEEPEATLNLRALILEDNRNVWRVYQSLLERWGCKCEFFPSCASAQEALESGSVDGCPFDVALLDNRLPDGSGVEFAKVLKNQEQIANLPLVLATSSFYEGLNPNQKSLFAGRIRKPLKKRQVLSVLRHIASKPELVIDREKKPTDEIKRSGDSRLLLVEDNRTHRRLVEILLKKRGYTFDVAKNGAEAVDIFEKQGFDLILMDCQMPVLDGFEASKKIRALERELGRSKAVIIALTANALKGDKERCLASGMDDYLTKPIEQVEFYRRIEKHLCERA